jgi:hypothetical protein
MSSALQTFIPAMRYASVSAPSSGASRAEIDGLRRDINLLLDKTSTSPASGEIEELKKFTEFLKFRLDSLDTRMAASEKIVSDMTSKLNIMEITMTALAAALKPASA